MKVNEKQFEGALSTISRDVNRIIMLSLYKNNVKHYKEIMAIVKKQKNCSDTNSAMTAYYVNLLCKNKVLKKDKITGWYYLTKIGIQLCELIDSVQKICMEYELDDLGADGKIMVMVQR